MRVLVTGATGFVGMGVVRALRARGHEVLGLVRDLEKARPLLDGGFTPALGDMWQPETYEPLVARVDAVVHAAQEQPTRRWSRRRIARMHGSDALMTRVLARACVGDHKPFVYSSGALTHAGYDGRWIDESAPPRPCLLACGHAEMVQELSEAHRREGLHVMVISPGFVYGPGGFLKMTVEMLLRRRYRIIGKGENYWSLVHVDDVGEAYALALERGSPGATYFLSDDTPLRRREVIAHVAAALGLPAVRHVPGWLVAAMLGSAMIEALNGSLRLRNERAKRDLGWVPRYVSFVERLPEVLNGVRG